MPGNPFDHMASYIDKDIVFTKGGPHKSLPFDFENWHEYFSTLKEMTRAFRCRKTHLPVRNKEIQSIEMSLTFLNEFGGRYSSSYLAAELEKLKKRVNKLQSVKQVSLRDVRELLALLSLEKSIDAAQNKSIVIQVDEGSSPRCMLITIPLIAEVRRMSPEVIVNRAAGEEKAAGASYKVVPKDEVRAGDSVVIIDSLSSGSDLNAGGVYAVIGMD